MWSIWKWSVYSLKIHRNFVQIRLFRSNKNGERWRFWKLTPLDCTPWSQKGDGRALFVGIFQNVLIRADGWNCIHFVLDTSPFEYWYIFKCQFISIFTINAKLWNMPNNWTLPKIGAQTVQWRHLLYRWWLTEEGTSRNVPIAGFEMILREDYKSRDEVEGLVIFPKEHFKSQDGNIPWCSRQQSHHLLYYMALR